MRLLSVFLWAVVLIMSQTTVWSQEGSGSDGAQGLTKKDSARMLPNEEILAEEASQNQNFQPGFSPYNAINIVPHTVKEIQQVSGAWHDKRNLLADKGVQFFVSYTANIAGNPVGGINPNGFTYADIFALGFMLETEPLFGWKGGYFTVSTIWGDGNGLSEKNIGNQFAVQEAYLGQSFYWYETFYEQQFLDDHVSFKIGRMVANDEFAASPLYWLYMNNGIDGTIQALAINQLLSYYPIATWGSMLRVDLPASTTARVGVYQTTEGSNHGMTWNFYPNDGVMLMAQYGWSPEFFKPSAANTNSQENSSKKAATPKGFQGHYWMGGYYGSQEYPQFNSDINQSNSYGFYWHADQTVYKPNPLSDAGLVLWSAATLCPQESISFIPFQINAGAVYTGLIPGRPHDFTIFGASYGEFSTSYAGVEEEDGYGYPTYELLYELGYRVNITETIYVQPTVEWVINPAGAGTIPNAFVVGAQMGVSF